MLRTTPENITELGPNEIFVFGSNTAGRHGRGAAKLAKEEFGAESGVGYGITGRCYAFPTLHAAPFPLPINLRKRSHTDLMADALEFHETARLNPQLTFLLTKVGCGLAGYDEDYMKWFFRDTPSNVIKPEGW